MKFQVVKAFSITTNGKRREYQLGQRISETQYNKLNKRVQAYLLPARKCSGLSYYTNEERELIAHLYHEGNNRNYIVSMFHKLFGKTHSVDSIGQKVEMCKSVDNTLKNNTEFQFRDIELICILQGLDSERYQLA